MNIFDKAPVVDKDVFVAPSASVIGDVQVGRGSSIWYGCVLRGKLSHWMNQMSQHFKDIIFFSAILEQISCYVIF